MNNQMWVMSDCRWKPMFTFENSNAIGQYLVDAGNKIHDVPP